MSSLIGTEVHRPGKHFDRTLYQLIGANQFDATITVTNNTPVIALTNGVDITTGAADTIPEGATSLDAIYMEFIQNNGVVTAGNAMFASAVFLYENGETIGTFGAGTTATSIPSEALTKRVLRTSAPITDGVSPPATLTITSDYLNIQLRRDATNVNDTFEDVLYLVGYLLQWTVDQ